MRSLPDKLCFRNGLMAALVSMLLCMTAAQSRGQAGSTGLDTPQGSQPHVERGIVPEDNPFPPALREKALKQQSEQRQKRLVSDATRLLALAQSLQSDVVKPNRETSSSEDLRKAEEIEKLARSVKDKMRAD